MQSDWKELYRIAAEKNNTSEQEYKDIGNFVFKALYNEQRRPTKLIIKLKGVGSWHLRRKRMQIVLDVYPVEGNNIPTNPMDLFKYENKVEVQKLFAERLKDYEEYITLRNEIRKIRNEGKTPLEPINRKDESS